MTIKGGKLRSIFMERQSRQENIIYIVLWAILFYAPVISLYVRNYGDANNSFDWNEVFMIWSRFVVYLLVFLVHNFFVAPILVYRQKRLLYTAIVVAILACFMVYQCSNRPKDMMQGPPAFELGIGEGPGERGEGPGERGEGPGDMGDKDELPPPYENGEFLDEDHLPHDAEGGPDRKALRGPDGKVLRHNPPPFVGEHDVVATVILFLMLGMNVGIKLYFRTREDQKRLVELEKENLEQQLEYLKYQINPHFFMNTLNNIHALVDIDAEKAKSTILELSKMMRFILYEGNKNGVPLTREFEFIRTYVTLMRLRYTDKVSIRLNLPSIVPERMVPPLMLITFIENAFKHGISYQHESFIRVAVVIKGDTLVFNCRNSKADMPNQEKGGVGLTNVRQRLNLLYGDRYTLDIQDEEDIYNVQLTIPLL